MSYVNRTIRINLSEQQKHFKGQHFGKLNADFRSSATAQHLIPISLLKTAVLKEHTTDAWFWVVLWTEDDGQT